MSTDNAHNNMKISNVALMPVDAQMTSFFPNIEIPTLL